MTLYEAWLEAKTRETVAVADRRKLEDQMVVAFHVPKNLDTTISHEIDGYKIKLEGRINKKIDAEKLQVIAPFQLVSLEARNHCKGMGSSRRSYH